jgi:alkaline phosphatase D
MMTYERALVRKEKTIRKLAFGSCNNQREKQPVWETIKNRVPDLFVWLGDIVYADHPVFLKIRIPGTPADVKESYQKQLDEHESYRSFMSSTPIVGVYDDHDTGKNDGDKYVQDENKKAAQQLLLDFLGVDDIERRSREGAYSDYILGSRSNSADGVLQLILLDNRYHRDRYESILPPLSIPLLENQKLQDMLGEKQWLWLEQKLQEGSIEGITPADILILGSGIQVISRNDPWVAESWGRLPQSKAKLLSLLALYNRSAVLISGDVHFAELSKTDCAFLGYPLFDATSSGMTHSWNGFLKRLVVGTSLLATNRVVSAAISKHAKWWIGQTGFYNERNFGEIDLNYETKDLTIRLLSIDGIPQIEQSVSFSQLKPRFGGVYRNTSTMDDIRDCAHARMDQGLSPSCKRLLNQCYPQTNYEESILYFSWHLAVGGAMCTIAAIMFVGPIIACIFRNNKRSTTFAVPFLVLLWAGVIGYFRMLH